MKTGQSLTVLLVVASMAIAIVGAAVSVIATNSQNGTKLVSGEQTLNLAESGAEEALLQLLRNPNYSGESLTTADGVATITVTGTNPKTIVSSAVISTFRRKIQVSASFALGKMTVGTWQEIN